MTVSDNSIRFSPILEFMTYVVEADPFLTVIGGFSLLFVVFYANYVAAKPEIIVRDGPFRQFLTKYCPMVTEKFSPTIWCYGTLAQTIVRPLIQNLTGKKLNYKREVLCTEDGGLVSLDWCQEDTFPADTGIVVLLPGLTGCSSSEYMVHFCMNIRRRKKRAVVFNYRGMGGVELKTARTYCSANTEDLSFVLHHVRKTNPSAKIICLGVSMGGMMLTHYLCDRNQENILQAAMAVSPPWNPIESSNSLEKPVNWLLFNRLLTKFLQGVVRRHSNILRSNGHDVDKVLQCRTVREFDENFTVKVFGYKDLNDYYNQASFSDKLLKMRIPVLYLNAADDVFSPRYAIPDDLLSRCDNVACVVTQHGGHNGFVDGYLIPSACTYLQRLSVQYIEAIFSHGEELKRNLAGIPPKF